MLCAVRVPAGRSSKLCGTRTRSQLERAGGGAGYLSARLRARSLMRFTSPT